MYKIIKQNSSQFKKGELIKDRQYYNDYRRIRAEGGIQPIVRTAPDIKFIIRNRNTGEIHESSAKYSCPAAALKAAINYRTREMYTGFERHDGYIIEIIRDGENYMGIDIKYAQYISRIWG